MNAPTPLPCYVCNDPIQPSKRRLVATFEGQQRDICRDCAVGIHDGSAVLDRLGVIGEYLGPCGDNQPQPPKP
jgi:hypothetical protein